MVAGEEPQVIGLQRRGSQLQRFAKLATPPIARHRQAPPSPTPAATNSAAFRNAAAPHRDEPTFIRVARTTRQLRTWDGNYDTMRSSVQ